MKAFAHTANAIDVSHLIDMEFDTDMFDAGEVLEHDWRCEGLAEEMDEF